MAKYTFAVGEKLTAARTNNFCQEGEVANSSLVTTAGQPGGAWVSYTPTVTGISNTTATGAYMRLGKTVFFRAKVLLGASSSVTATPEITLPLASATDVPSSAFEVRMVDANVLLWYSGQGIEVNADAVSIYALRDQGSTTTYSYGVGVSSAIPFTWTTSDYIEVSGCYETSAA
jgi:hypothetical protein